jgi:predicted transcriptional regulator
MRKFKLISVQKNENLFVVLEKIHSNNCRTVLVLNKKKIIGVISEGDIIKSLTYNKSLDIVAEKLMNKSFKFLKTNDLVQAKKIFKNTGIGLIPILKKNMELKSYITILDII